MWNTTTCEGPDCQMCKQERIIKDMLYRLIFILYCAIVFIPKNLIVLPYALVYYIVTGNNFFGAVGPGQYFAWPFKV